MSLAEIQRRLGHEDIQTTINIYGRMIEEFDAEVAARADALFVPKRTVIEGTTIDGEIVAGQVIEQDRTSPTDQLAPAESGRRSIKLRRS